MRKAIQLFKWVLCQSVLSLAVACSVYAGPGGQAWMPNTNAQTVQGKAPGVANGLATLDASSNVVQSVVSANTATSLSFATESNNLYSMGSITVSTIWLSVMGEATVGTVTTGDKIWISGYFVCTKGATAGGVGFRLGKSSGSASIATAEGLANYPECWQYAEANNNTYQYRCMSLLSVTAGGTLYLSGWGISNGSDCIYSGGSIHARMYYGFLKKQ